LRRNVTRERSARYPARPTIEVSQMKVEARYHPPSDALPEHANGYVIFEASATGVDFKCALSVDEARGLRDALTVAIEAAPPD
jgi:hypothetical protein